jgi:hypothetical protein
VILSLPPLVAPSNIEPQNVLAVGAIYAAYQLEQMQLFRVTDRIVEMFQQGTLPVGRTSGNRLTKYWQAGPDRLTESERRALYVRTFGVGGDDQAPQPNRDFNRLWMRFVSAVAETSRSRSREADIRQRGRDLAVNLSLHGYGVGYFAASRLQDHVTAAQRLLSMTDIRAAFGARDMWQVIDAVSTNELGGARNISRYRTLAVSGLEIIRWLAAQGAAGRRRGTRVGVPTPALAKACESWLAASASTDDEDE